ncbi:MAG TPA: helix-turn-helix transcriptional regulator [Gammaproteobacteria bacterium]|jgi:transcriptional regulator with XRE-family HTH domain
MDLGLAIKKRLQELGLEQKDLATAAEVTDSYISQLLNRRKLPPAPDRTDIYEKMDKFLRISKGELARLARAQRLEEYQRGYAEPEVALLKETRELILRKCEPGNQRQIRSIFEKQSFGELERLVTQKLLEVARQVTRSELDNEAWLREVAQLCNKSYQQLRVIMLEFLDTDIFNVSNEDCVSFLDPLIRQWDIDLSTFDMEISLNDRLVPGEPKKFAFVEQGRDGPRKKEPGLVEFLQDPVLSRDITGEELEFLTRLRFGATRRPNRLYYYRTLQNLRDPLHFGAVKE